jgi:hypothetical protein
MEQVLLPNFLNNREELGKINTLALSDGRVQGGHGSLYSSLERTVAWTNWFVLELSRTVESCGLDMLLKAEVVIGAEGIKKRAW